MAGRAGDGCLICGGTPERRRWSTTRDDVQHWVSITGLVELVREGDEPSIEDAKTMARRYGDDPEGFNGQHRVSFNLVPERVTERS
jgi:hypothetical protein